VSAPIEIRSYRRVFDLERRIYSIDQLRLNPGGVPVRGVIYFATLLVSGLTISRLPVIGVACRLLPWYVRYAFLPGALAMLLSVIRLEGRTFHLAALALARYRLAPRQLVCLRSCPKVGERWFPDEVVLLPDGSDARLRKLRYTGPGAVLVLVEHDCRGSVARPGLTAAISRSHVVLSGAPRPRRLARGKVVALSPGVSLTVRCRTDRLKRR
jgi:hypothetical protein